jgi:AraC-like DNA-binding protein
MFTRDRPDRRAPRAGRCRWTTLQVRSPRVALRPAPPLRTLLAHGYNGFHEDPARTSGFVIPASLATPLVVSVEESRSGPPALVYGPNDSFTLVDGDRPHAYLEVCLAPLGAYTLFGPVVADVRGSIVGLDDLIGSDARRLGERVQSAPTWVERARVVDAFLLDRSASGPEPSSEVSEAWDLLVRSDGTRPIGAIARQVGWSHKHLITRFKQQVGVAPRLAARLLRLSRVWRLIDSGQSWARIAAESGYADQAHLVREFRQFTGRTPSALVA